MTNFEFQIDNFMLYCSSKNLSKKTLASYEQALKLFAFYAQKEFDIVEVERVQTAHVRHYIKYLRERGKYTVSVALTVLAWTYSGTVSSTTAMQWGTSWNG
ncbi:site-specific integrase [Tumebacillus flagellatus]|uniref:Core-binding (CB) domain-containing protein n=1 Tax=Tumebacillus flagellatus TaxID=1157490 RepID=A0A074LS13_9BACL|nr:site-specific integrase [Tumebacillus flagellatus]KEO83275.1 hypothetical protein EL26_11335 [Tumebacillus flagellatus]